MIDLGSVVPDREDHSLDMVDTIQGSIGISEVNFKSVKDFNYFNMSNSAKIEKLWIQQAFGNFNWINLNLVEIIIQNWRFYDD